MVPASLSSSFWMPFSFLFSFFSFLTLHSRSVFAASWGPRFLHVEDRLRRFGCLNLCHLLLSHCALTRPGFVARRLADCTVRASFLTAVRCVSFGAQLISRFIFAFLCKMLVLATFKALSYLDCLIVRRVNFHFMVFDQASLGESTSMIKKKRIFSSVLRLFSAMKP